MDYRWPVIIRYVGLALAIYEVSPPPGDNFLHPSALVLAGGMMGLKEIVGARKKNGATA